MDINYFITELKKLQIEAPRPQGINLFFDFVKAINLTSKFKYQDYTNQTNGIKYYCIFLNKWVIFDQNQKIVEYIFKKYKSKIYFDINFYSHLENQGLSTILLAISNFRIRDYDSKVTQLQPELVGKKYTSCFIHSISLEDYDICVYYCLTMVIFSKYEDLMLDSSVYGWGKKVRNYTSTLKKYKLMTKKYLGYTFN